MVKKILLTLLLLLTLSSSVMASLRLDSTTTTPTVIKPGDEVDLTLRIQNVETSDNDPKYSYVLELKPRGDLSKENIIIIDGEDNLGRIGTNEYWNSKFNFKVKEGAPSTTYEFDVLMKKYLDGSLLTTNTAVITVDVSGETFFGIDSEDKSIQQGETKTFDAVLRNLGGASAGNVKLTFGNSENIQVVGTNTFYFPTVDYNEEKPFEITLHASNSIASGTYTIPVTIEYNDGTEIKVQNMQAGIIVGGDVNLRVASVETSPKEIRPGDNYVLVSLNLENSGDDAAKAISARLVSENFKSSYSDGNYIYSGRIDSGSFSNMKFYFDVPKNTVSGIYNPIIKLEYENLMGDKFNKSLEVPIHVMEKPILEITTVEAIGKAGETITVKVDVTNQGEENAEEVDIRLITDSSLPFSIEERSVYIGSIKSDETKTAIFNIKADKSAEINDYSIRAFLRARGDSEIGDNNIYTYNKDVNVTIDGKAMNKLAVFGGAFAAIVLAGLVFRRKKINTKK